jgi:hypothetical protein
MSVQPTILISQPADLVESDCACSDSDRNLPHILQNTTSIDSQSAPQLQCTSLLDKFEAVVGPADSLAQLK